MLGMEIFIRFFFLASVFVSLDNVCSLKSVFRVFFVVILAHLGFTCMADVDASSNVHWIR